MEAIKHYASLPFADMDTCNLCGNYDTIQCWIDIADGVFLHVCEECALKTGIFRQLLWKNIFLAHTQTTLKTF